MSNNKGYKSPPKFAEFILRKILPDEGINSPLGDFEEDYNDFIAKNSQVGAWLWYYLQILKIIPGKILNSIHRSAGMLLNYLKIAFRSIKRSKGYSFINITGLVIGLTCAMLIMMYIQYELSFDTYHENSEEIYRVVMWQKGNKYQGTEWFNATPGALKSIVTEEVPEVLKAARVPNRGGIIKIDSNLYTEYNIYYADPEFLEMFTFPLISGSPETALIEPYTILLTEDMKKKYFGNENPIGKFLNINNKEYTITGILKNVPKNSHFTFDFLASMATQYSLDRIENLEGWRSNDIWNTYLLIQKGSNIIEVENKVTALLKKYKDERNEGMFKLQPLKSIHLHSNVNFDVANVGDIKHVYIFSSIAFLIILIACLNYMNLSTARSVKRAKEVGVRKVVGAYRISIMKQFFSESTLFVLIAFLLAIVLVYLLEPAFGELVGRDLNFSLFSSGGMIIGLISLALVVGLISGSYPAVILSAFKPINVIRGALKSGQSKSSGFRNTLVVMQFTISVILIVCSLIIYNQLDYVQTKNLGYEKEHIVYGSTGSTMRENFQPFKSALEKNPSITEIYAQGDIPAFIGSNNNANWEGKTEGEGFLCYNGRVNYNFLDFFGIKLLDGRDFSREFSTDVDKAWILNETAVKIIGWDNPIGKKFKLGSRNPEGVVIGVVKDFHNTSLKLEVEPLALQLIKPDRKRKFYALKLSSGNIPETLAFIEEKYTEFSPDLPFNYTFLDERLERMYRSERKLGQIINYFTFIAIFISCLGLFGLASYTAEQKTKEIGIRKVLGASSGNIIKLVSKEFLQLIILANVISWPVAWYVMNGWLLGFAYRIDLGVGIYLSSGLIVLIIALLTVSYQSLRAAMSDPVDSLRYE